jgi:pyruvate dehydrogenase E1 component
LAEDKRDIGVLAVTSADRLNAGWTAAQQARSDGQKEAKSHIETLLSGLSKDTVILSVIDGHPATLSWLGGVAGQRTLSHGVEHFGQTGSIADLYRHFRLDTQSLVQAALMA